MTDQEKINALRLALSGAIGALEACEIIMKREGLVKSAEFCANLVADYKPTLAATR